MIKCKVLEMIMSKYNLKENNYIDIRLMNKICKLQKIDIKDLQCMLEISSNTLYKLKNGIQKSTKIVFNKYNGIEKDSSFYENKINYEMFINIRNSINVKDYTLVRMLGISTYGYRKIKEDITYSTRIKDIKLKHTVDLIKIDLKYLNRKYKYISVTRINDMCMDRNISIDSFAKYYSNNPKHYKFNLMILGKSSKGFWIGKNIKMPDSFINKYYSYMITRLKCVYKKVSNIVNCGCMFEDLIHDTFTELYNKCGSIVLEFYFDVKVLFNILMSKAKYIMLNIYKKNYSKKDISYDSFIDTSVDHISFLKDNTYNPEFII